MWTPYNQRQDVLAFQCMNAFRMYVLIALMLSSSFSLALELEELSVTELDGEFRLRILSVVDAHVDYVYEVITDYEHAYRINPSITKVEILPSNREEVVRVRNLSEHWIGPFRYEIDWVGDITEDENGSIKVNTIPELSSFESGYATWELQSQGDRTLVYYKSRMNPDFFVPPLIGTPIVISHIKRVTLDTFNRIECFAKAMLEIDMENEIEPIENAITEGKECINHKDS